jgi:hypothetical protein
MHDVQFEMLSEQLKQGLLQAIQLPFTKNLVESAQEVHVFKLEQARQGETQESQKPSVELAYVVVGQIFRQVPLYKYELLKQLVQAVSVAHVLQEERQTRH